MHICASITSGRVMRRFSQLKRRKIRCFSLFFHVNSPLRLVLALIPYFHTILPLVLNKFGLKSFNHMKQTIHLPYVYFTIHYSVVTFQTMTYDIFYRLVAFAKCKNLNKKSSPLLYAAFLINQLIRFHMQALFIHSLDADTFQ